MNFLRQFWARNGFFWQVSKPWFLSGCTGLMLGIHSPLMVLAAAGWPEQEPAIELRGDGQIPSAFSKKLKSHRLIIVGEMHGSNEIPAFVEKIAREMTEDGGNLLVGLEIFTRNEGKLCVSEGNEKQDALEAVPQFASPIQDGRGSQAMAFLIRQLSRMPNVNVFGFDPEMCSGTQDRETRMALRISQCMDKFRPKRTLILVGNIHAAKRTGLLSDASYRPMAVEIMNQENSGLAADDIYTIKVDFEKGETWSLVNGKPGRHNWENKQCAFVFDDRRCDSLFIAAKPGTGFDGILFMRRITMSRPYFSPNKRQQATETRSFN